MRYIAHTKEQVSRILNTIGVSTVDELFAAIPAALRLKRPLDLPAPLCEAELLDELTELGSKNAAPSRGSGVLVFAGAGCHPHAIPAAVDSLAARSEFYTAYTPYQPELSQGTLLAIFEFQTVVAELFGMEVANASMYDGASATAEAIMMAQRLTGRDKAIVAGAVHPEYVRVCKTYLHAMAHGSELVSVVPVDDNGRVDLAAVKRQLTKETAAVVVQSPNFFGLLEDVAPLAEAAHEVGALLVTVCTEPLAMGLTRPPGAAGADIAVGEGLGLAGPPNLGGPGVGLFAATGKKAVRSMPGRIVGETVDKHGERGLVLTLSTREQHIRREKATSNICTNHGLMALRMMIHLALLGKTGFERLARINHSKAVYAKQQLSKAGVRGKFAGPFFNEFTVAVPAGTAAEVVERSSRAGLVPGVALSRFYPGLDDTLLISVTERHKRQDIDRLVEAIR